MYSKIDFNKVIENDYELNLYTEKVKQILEYLDNNGPKSFWDIIRAIGGSERRILRLINEMEKQNYLTFSNNRFCTNTVNTNIISYDKIEKKLITIWSKKPHPTFIYDQRPVTLKTTLKRVKYLDDKNDICNKKIVLLGDDDLTSIGLALTKKAKEIKVLDIDERLVKFINEIADEYNLNLVAEVYNALEGIKDELKNKYDIFMTDPTPEKIPLILFMNNGFDLLNKENGVIYTSIYSTAMEKTLSLQRIITDMNLYITDIISNFTEYQAIPELYKNTDWDLINKYNIEIDDNSICFTESLFRMELTKESRKIAIEFKGADIFGKATKRVIENYLEDVSAIKKDEEFIDIKSKDIAEISDKTFFSGGKALGNQALFDLMECESSELNNIKFVEKTMIECIKQANLNVIKSTFHKFLPQGISGVVILEESHVTIHTWPEYNCIIIDAFTCGKHNPSLVCEKLAEAFKSKKVSNSEFRRGSINE